MKISKLHIDSFRHIENLEFDFTYPNNFHDESKRGKPLDKICFIGQSATGKTGLLELIYDKVNALKNTMFSEKQKVFTIFDFQIFNDSTFEFISNKSKIELQNDGISINSLLYKNSNLNIEGPLFDDFEFSQTNLYYFKSGLISERNVEIFAKNPVELLEIYRDHLVPNLDEMFDNYQYETFNENVNPATWIKLLSEILDYRKKFNQKMSELIHKGLLANQNKLQIEFNLWQKENPNTLELFAQKFNPILEKLNLEVDIVNTEYSIPIKNKKNDEVIPIQNTSTGTKGLLLSFLPLFKLDTKDSIILIDEPERSLYPDMQTDLMEYYQNLAPEAQFIIATHSPFIAASFEPEERFILYFDEKGKVAVRRGNSPIGDDPNDMLKNDFGINYYNKYGEAAYKKYIQLKEKVAKEEDPTKKKKLLLETVKLGDTYNF